ncbi:MAG TPA: zinc-dependent metalloprotease family protein [Dermatophilaceae bacterium]|nr:zinc-dependent metalloprotease family protein [Dermatophilaceae bacterium]
MQDVVVEPRPQDRVHRPAVTVRVLRTEAGTVPLAAGSLPDNNPGDRVAVRVDGASASSGEVPRPGTSGAARGRSGAAETAATAAATADATGRAALRVLSSTTRSRADAPVRTAPGSAATSPAVRQHLVYVALVRPRGYSADSTLTPAKIAATLNRVDGYWSSQTAGRIRFTLGTPVRGWWSTAKGCQDIFGIWDEMQAQMERTLQMKPNTLVGAYRHLVLVVPRATAENGDCHYGYATVGAAASGGSSGGTVYLADLNQSLMAHEIGHNLGLHHANSLTCSTTQDAVFRSVTGFGDRCRDREYDDLFDVMGYSGVGFGEGNLNGPHLDAMGLLPAAIRRLPLGTTKAAIPWLSSGKAARVLRVTDPAGGLYYVEYRTATGPDAVTLRSRDRPTAGVRVLRPDPRYRGSIGSYELDATPAGGWDYVRALSPGATFVSAGGGVRITVTGQTPSAATVVVTAARASSRSAAPARLSITVPARVIAGRKALARTVVTGARGRVVANWPVTLQRLLGRSKWRPVGVTTTSSRGTASLTIRPRSTEAYRWLSAPSAVVPSKTSQTARLVVVRAQR